MTKEDDKDFNYGVNLPKDFNHEEETKKAIDEDNLNRLVRSGKAKIVLNDNDEQVIELSQKVLQGILQPTSTKKLSKKEQFEQDVKANFAKSNLDLIKKQLRKNNKGI